MEINNQENIVSKWMERTRKKIITISVILTLVWLLIISNLTSFLQFSSALPLILITPAIILAFLTAQDQGFLKGKLMFGVVALAVIFEPLARLVSTVLFQLTNLSSLLPATLTIGMLAAYWLSVKFVPKQILHKTEQTKIVLKFPKTFMFSCLITGLSAIAFFKIDTVIVDHLLTQTETGLYALLGLPAKMIFFVGSLPTSFILPLATKKFESSQQGKKIVIALASITLLFTLAGYIFFGVIFAQYGHLVLGDAFLSIAGLLPYFGIGVATFCLSQIIVTFHLAKHRYAFPTTSFVVSIFQVLALLFLVDNLADAVNVMMYSGIAQLLILTLLHIFYKQALTLGLNFQYFLQIFTGKVFATQSSISKQDGSDSLRILIFNWRDIRHVWSGGAEIYIHELAKELIAAGHKVTIFCGNDEKSPRNQVIEGVQIIRRGGFYTVYFWAFVYYVLRLRKYTDLIIDSENGIPFMTPLYSRKPIILLIHHVHQEVFRKHLKFPLREIAEFIEGKLMPFFYHEKEIVTVSESSKADILKLGLVENFQISVINPGIRISNNSRTKKSKTPLLSYVGRLKPYKNIEIAIIAVSKIIPKYPELQFHIAGTGESQIELQDLIKVLGIQKNVKLLGNISDDQKASLFTKSWVAIQPSMIEGWGITVIEANACGTPVIASNVKGLKDSVVDGNTGWLVEVGKIDDLATKISSVLSNPILLSKISKSAKSWSKKFTWKNSGKSFEKIISDSVYKNIDAIEYEFNSGISN